MAQKADKNEVSRIYQGRVTECRMEEKVVDLSVLMRHHTLFQDAVNYYMLALAAMASDPESAVGKFRERMAAPPDKGGAWEDFWRNGIRRPGMKHSILRTFGITDKDLSFDQAAALILKGNSASKDVLQAAVSLIAKKCEGDVKMQGPTYSPRLSNRKYGGNYDYDAVALSGKEGAGKLHAALLSSDPVPEVSKLSRDLSMTWLDIKIQDGKFFQGEEAKIKLKEAVAFFLNEPQKKSVQAYFDSRVFSVNEKLTSYLDGIHGLPDMEFERNNKADKAKRNAFLLMKAFPDDFTVGLVATFVENIQKANKTSVAADANSYGLPDDPVKLARGARGYVFPYFTALRMVEPWNKLDIEAFTEALKTLNQFAKKGVEREGKRKGFEYEKAYMDGIGKAPRANPEESEDGDASPLPVLAGDPRWKLLKKLLRELGVSNSFTEDEIVEYGLAQRTMRNFHELRPRWQKILNAERVENVTQALVEELHDFQTKNRDRMGSADLYHKLAEPDYWDLWREDYPVGKNQSRDILNDVVRYFEICSEIERLKEPINFTPADPLFSRRLNNLKKMQTGSKSGHGNGMTFSTQLAVAGSDGRFSPKTCILTYSAPRLLRDGLRGTDTSRYLSPVLQALAPDMENHVDFSKCAVQLMPDADASGMLRYLLNFQLKLPIGAITRAIKNPFTPNQFYFSQQLSERLLWPGIANGKNVPDWYKDGKTFSVLSVDLGQRTAGALCRIKVSPGPVKNPHAIFLGNDGARDWFAERTYAEVLRLPGEDAKIWMNGKRKQEPYGDKGRPATESETAEALAVCKKLMGTDDLLTERKNLSFSEQNDKLLVALRRAQSRWSRTCRWIWMLNTPEKREKALAEYLACDFAQQSDVPKILEQLATIEAHLRTLIPDTVLVLANRILPLRGRDWEWVECVGENGIVSRQLRQTPRGSNPAKKKICGQRGLSFLRITQLEEFRKRIQSLNRSWMRKPGDPPQRASEMREQRIADPCPDILRRLDHMKENRVNQTANLILTQALGVRRKAHAATAQERASQGIHGEYETISGVEPVAFIALENLSRYRFSQDRSRFENSRLMKWAHRQVRDKIELLAEVFGIPVLDVHAAYSSKFSPDGIPGFRAEEATPETFMRWPWNKRLADRDPEALHLFGQAKQLAESGRTVLLPKDGGPVFVPFRACDTVVQADMNAAFNIGLRAAADPRNHGIHNRINIVREKNILRPDRASKLNAQIFRKDDVLDCSNPAQAQTTLFCLPIPRTFIDGGKGTEFRFRDDGKKDCVLIAGKDLWGAIKFGKAKRCMDLNEKRIRKAKKG